MNSTLFKYEFLDPNYVRNQPDMIFSTPETPLQYGQEEQWMENSIRFISRWGNTRLTVLIPIHDNVVFTVIAPSTLSHHLCNLVVRRYNTRIISISSGNNTLPPMLLNNFCQRTLPIGKPPFISSV
jgi:hypothetical protein